MRSKITVNPLMLLIMTQAWCHVKRHHLSAPSPQTVSENVGPDGGFPLSSVSESASPETEALSIPVSGKVFKPDTWNFVWSHPFFKSTADHGALSVRQLARHWGDCSQGLPMVSCEKSLSDALAQSQEHGVRAIKIEWNNDWKIQDLPAWLIKLLNERHDKEYQVWMSVRPTDVLSDDVCRKAVQLGWSWWFMPPDSVQGFPDYFKNSLPQWRFWFTNPQSDQWVWPWADILVKVLCEKSLGSTQDRYWIGDMRQKGAWAKLDEEAWDQLEKIMGGSGLLQSLIDTTFHQLSQVDFLDRLVEP